jgi:hypothetical protein
LVLFALPLLSLSAQCEYETSTLMGLNKPDFKRVLETRAPQSNRLKLKTAHPLCKGTCNQWQVAMDAGFKNF